MADQVQADGRQRAGLDRAELLEQLDRTGRARGRERIRVLLHLAPQLPAQRPRQALEPLVLPVVEALLEALPARSAGELGLARSEEHTSELQSLMRISYAVFCLQKKNKINSTNTIS